MMTIAYKGLGSSSRGMVLWEKSIPHHVRDIGYIMIE